MMRNKWIRRTALTAVLVLPVLVAGCGIWNKGSKGIDPPQVELEDQQKDGAKSTLGAVDVANMEGAENITVYLQDRNGYLAPVSLPAVLGAEEEAGQRVLEMMVDNGTYANALPEDFRALIPQGTQVLGYEHNPETHVVKVDFSESFADYNSQDERAIVESITWALTSLPDVQGVEIYHEGEKLAEMPAGGLPMDQVLTREMGINLELASGVNYTNSYPVTLYFSGLTYYDEQYYVPVTRLINRSDSTAHAAMEELIAGPLNKKELTAVIMPGVEVLSIEEKDGVVTIDVEDSTYVSGQPAPSEMLEAVVLSLTENTSAQAVQIKVNGKTDVVDDRNQVYSKPVSKPLQVNAIKS